MPVISGLSIAHERYIQCPGCGFAGLFEVVGLGEGTGLTEAQARWRAHREARADASRLARIARCPQCGLRDEKALGRYRAWVGKALLLSGGMAAAFGGGSWAFARSAGLPEPQPLWIGAGVGLLFVGLGLPLSWLKSLGRREVDGRIRLLGGERARPAAARRVPMHLFAVAPARARAAALRAESAARLEAARASPAALAPLLEASLEEARLGAALDSVGNSVARPLRTAAQAGAALFTLSRSPAAPVDLPLGAGNPARFAEGLPEGRQEAATWLTSAWAALATRDWTAMALLAAVPARRLAPGAGHQEPLARALRELLRGGDRQYAGDLLAEAQESVRASSGEAARDLDGPAIAALRRAVARDRSGYEAALAEALEAHRRHWSVAGRADFAEGFLALPLVGVASLAHDAGLAAGVLSEYLPRPVVEAPRPSGPLVCCPYCLVPMAEGTALCPACAQDVRNDAAVELTQDGLLGGERAACTDCGEPMPVLAVRCASCRARRAPAAAAS